MIEVKTKAKDTKANARYEEHSAHLPDHCATCEYFEVKAKNRCLKVEGKIISSGWCRWYEEEEE